jgi:hypothetical protein
MQVLLRRSGLLSPIPQGVFVKYPVQPGVLPGDRPS